jgi:hypothetical protein
MGDVKKNKQANKQSIKQAKLASRAAQGGILLVFLSLRKNADNIPTCPPIGCKSILTIKLSKELRYVLR